jgi:hypothetical protein
VGLLVTARNGTCELASICYVVAAALGISHTLRNTKSVLPLFCFPSLVTRGDATYDMFTKERFQRTKNAAPMSLPSLKELDKIVTDLDAKVTEVIEHGLCFRNKSRFARLERVLINTLTIHVPSKTGTYYVA